MADQLVTFNFTVICTEFNTTDCKFPDTEEGKELDNFKNRMSKITKDIELGNPERLNQKFDEKSGLLLVLNKLNAYAGPLSAGQLTAEYYDPARSFFNALPPHSDRYARPLFIGEATGIDIFTKSLDDLDDELRNALQSKDIQSIPNGPEKDAKISAKISEIHTNNMLWWRVKFNFLLHEIFGWNKDGNPPYVKEYARLDIDPQIYHPKEFVANPNASQFDHSTTHPWYAAWTVFVTSSGTPYGMNGGGAC